MKTFPNNKMHIILAQSITAACAPVHSDKRSKFISLVACASRRKQHPPVIGTCDEGGTPGLLY
ncbi:MAG: hypothetical protein C3F06_01135 [Candidatus Methanoperedenaceae archaeon]|nr:MAG: hypothetical protein C3F06_01135 [Candidatus Methanoperedenaceae archaeon]